MKSKVKAKSKELTPPTVRQRRGRTSTSRISTQNQVTVPVDILRASGIREGDEVVFLINGTGEIEMQKVERDQIKIWEAALDHLAAGGIAFPADFDWEKERVLAWGE